jgi:opacity protein-like surface antigen
MKKSLGRMGFLCVFLLIAGVLVAGAHAEKTRIRVVVENASIRVKPDLQGGIIKTPPIGSIFEAERKEGDWYEIKLKTEVGVMITAYIHEMFVEILSAETEHGEVEKKPEEPKSPREIKKAAPEIEQAPQETTKRIFPKFSLAFMGGIVSGSFVNKSTSYSDDWSEGILESVTESGTIRHEFKRPFGFTVSMSYFIFGGLGLQLRADYNTKVKISDDQGSQYNMVWSWTSGAGPFDVEEVWPVTGEFSLMPISLNLIYKIQGSGVFIPYISAGVTYFTGNVKISTRGAYAFSYVSGDYRRIEYLSLPLGIDESLSGVGFNLNGGFDIRLMKNMALTVDAAYFIKSKTEKKWAVAPGTYPGNNFPELSWIIDQESAEILSDALGTLSINPSFFKVVGGIKFIF